MRLTRRLAAAVGIVLLCGAGGVSTAGESRADPAITPADIDPLAVSLDDIKAISGGGYLNSAVSDQPVSGPAADPGGACQLALSSEADPAVFGTGWTAFRYVDTTGSNIYLRQAIGVYPDPAKAQDLYDELDSGLRACALTGTGKIAIASLKPNGATWLEPGDRPCAEAARVVKNVLFRVGSCRQEPAAAVMAVAEQISARINAKA